ncbi:MAG: radical SAM protein [Clostridium sp.]|uniref:radical SAM protein n=1 Tax=Romboutsia timonensis TaxID=1776391 RepID=UPI001ED0080D|nr:radical SAM protein [Clostridium sp.]
MSIICKDNKLNLSLQLHITGKCNQHCKHCYHTEYVNEPMSFEDIKNIVEQFKNLIVKYNEAKGINQIGKINVTGGEPFVRKDFMEILELFYQNRKYFEYSILTNGSFITDEIADKLKNLEVVSIQVSIDGDIKTHDMIRGNGNFQRTMKAVDILNKYNIPTIVSFTASKLNYKDFPMVAKHCEEHKVRVLWSDRLVPIGNGKSIKEQCLSATECLEFFRLMKIEKDRLEEKKSITQVAMARSLQFIVNKGTLYRCLAGDSSITIDEFGNILPCRRMPIKCGNVLKDDLIDVYFNNEVMNDLRTQKVAEGCSECRFKKYCNGGARCISYAINNNYNIADPFCPLIYYNRNQN